MTAETSHRTPIDETRRLHPRAYEPWRAIDELILRAMAHARTGVADMADRLGRTEAEVRGQLGRLGLI